ncbi:MAG: AcrB/AcrD/AcrF family protein [Candidatus Aminicenantes bacterium]|nr:AcrB/AcrD/AcrF family protein [Candidatus Aminicenantes bacterium]
MNIAEFSIRKNVITITLALVLLFVGIKSFQGLPRLEDPEFTIKDVIIATPYPGASAIEVEEEVSNVMEMAVQELGQVKYVESISSRGFSQVKVRMKDKYDKTHIPQIKDELRRKVNDYQRQLPPGAGPSVINDDFGDVYGIYLALTGEGYSYAELYEHVKLLRRELLLVQDVKRIILYGVQAEVVWVEMSRPKMATLGISQDDIYNALTAKNLPVDAGRLELGTFFIPINPTGEFKSEQEFGDLLISARFGDRMIYLKDVATVKRGYMDPPRNILRFDGKKAIGIGISCVMGGNVVTMGEAIEQRLKELENQTPLGMELYPIAMQSESVTVAISAFMINLLQAVAIVFIVLLFAMGMRSGLIIGSVLFITIFGSFIFMGMRGIMLERISLGALIIALGMLVDNAIVVVDGMKVRIERGEDRIKAASAVVGQTSTPLLGATVVAVLAFAAIGTSPDPSGEFCRSLFLVILISLMLSWVTAVTITPLFGKMFLKGKPKGKESTEDKDPYAGGFFQIYKKGLIAAMRFRWFTMAAVLGIFFISLYGFGFVKTMFFPNSTRPQFFIECYLPEGLNIRETQAQLAKAEKYLMEYDEVAHVATAVGGADPRFLLTYTPGTTSSSYGMLLLSVDDYRVIDRIIPKIGVDLEEMIPDGIINVRKFLLGPGEGGTIQLRIHGPDRTVLREMARKAKEIMYTDGGAKAIRDEWKEKVKVVRPLLAEAQARQLGITRQQLGAALRSAFEGKQTGVYREGEELLPIIARAPELERIDVDNIQNLQIWSPAAQQMIPMRQVLTGFATETEDANIQRKNRTTMIRVHCDPKAELPSELFARIKPEIEKALNVDVGSYLGKSFGPDEDPFANFDHTTIKVVDQAIIPLKDLPGYFISWGGQLEDSSRAQAAIAKSLPVFFGLMVLIIIFLFNAVREPLIIWLTVPLAIIGVTLGLLLFKQPFGFMAMLGLLSLSGMLIKNAIVLIDQINLEIREGKQPYWAVVDSGVSRMRPVMLAAGTTILGMIPLLRDAFFVSMAVTIMFGLLVASVLTLVVVPVLYTIFFRIPSPKSGE